MQKTINRTGNALFGRFVPMVSCMLLMALGALATTKREFLTEELGPNAKLKKKTVVITAPQRKRIEKKWHAYFPSDTMAFVVARDSDGKLKGAVCYISIYLEEWGKNNHVGVSFGPDGKIKRFALIGEHDPFARKLDKKWFAAQFVGKGLKPFFFNRDINGVSGATVSASIITRAVAGAAAVFQLTFLIKQEKK